MRKRTIAAVLSALVVLALVLISGCSYGGTKGTTTTPQTGGAGNAVSIENLSFNPTTVEVKVGDTVTWTNNDGVSHTVTGDSGLDSGTLAAGATYSKTFDAAGTYEYGCSIHPDMKGTVVVK